MQKQFTFALCTFMALVAPARAEFKSPAPLPAAPRARVHTLGKGETLWTVAVQYGLSVKAIKDVNAFDDADHLPAGTAVNLPNKPSYSLADGRSEFRPVSFVQPRGTAAQMLPAPPTIETAPGVTDIEADASEDGGAELSGVQVSIPKSRGSMRSPAGLSRGVAKMTESPESDFIWPVDGFIISPFGKRRRRHIHAGVDLKAPSGTEVHAARDGRVVFSGTIRGHGRVVVLAHDDGFHTVYAHNQKNVVSPEKDGERVIKAGELIALVGASGNATTPHVHFEIRQDEKPVDPMKYLPAQ